MSGCLGVFEEEQRPSRPSSMWWDSTQWLLCWMVRNASMLGPHPAPSHRWSSWLLAARGPGRGCRRPPQAGAQLVGDDLDGGAGAAVLGGPAPMLESAHDHDPAALGE